MKPTILYHWSPKRNRESIKKHGIKPNSEWTTSRSCWSNSPSFAWALSAGMRMNDKRSKLWDLWMTWSNHSDKAKWFKRKDWPRDGVVFEYRTQQTIKGLWLVGTRGRG